MGDCCVKLVPGDQYVAIISHGSTVVFQIVYWPGRVFRVLIANWSRSKDPSHCSNDLFESSGLVLTSNRMKFKMEEDHLNS